MIHVHYIACFALATKLSTAEGMELFFRGDIIFVYVGGQYYIYIYTYIDIDMIWNLRIFHVMDLLYVHLVYSTVTIID